jgi:uncharacterized protein
MLTKASNTEEEYFAKEQAQRLKSQALSKVQSLQDHERRVLKEKHWMRCPRCGMELQSLLFKGVTMNKCFSCHTICFDEDSFERISIQHEPFFEAVTSIFK